ncbi:MAG: potassium transporter Kup [Bradyrhizobium sp.]|jgi:KUP system potassium uptake protein|uniref:potassium transporter Kup n=1 Tax=Bradyrhizobium sp. TaxID=376 RepID=UPI0011FB6C5F|nr:potassium transporter Kup [Bradyrhizobium sp.]THD55056.1 MAG: potassium transporter Kup [Bradyrhizobium sp.]
MSTIAIAENRSAHAPRGSLGALALGALGVVYGDIGTSPLYTLKTALDWGGGATPEVAIGMLSLIVWTLLITTSIKYVGVVMRADNDGEGGILALMSLLGIKHGDRPVVIAIGVFGAALLYGDGAITPAISVLSAIEGLKLPVPEIAPYVVPLSVAVLVAIFALQPQGSARIGKLFGPIMTVWFIAIGALGLGGVMTHPGVLVALDPRYGFGYLFTHGLTGFLVLGAVFLCATGAEALYADMGHFGARPIRIGWYGLVLPMLVLNYAGQAAAVVEGAVPAEVNPFFVLCPAPLQVPLVLLATLATIIASQAIISGAFSMTRQAIQLGLCPRLHITQTSEQGYGQIYVGSVNWVLMTMTLGLTLAFRSSDNLAAAFGVAVSLTMLLTSVLMFLVMREIWNWKPPTSLVVAGLFIVVDLSFVAANLMKVFEGGFVPLVVAAVIFFLIWTWRRGRALMMQTLERDTLPLASFIKQIHGKSRVPGTAVYMTSRTDVVPVPLLHNLKHNKVIHQRIVLLHVVTGNAPYIAADQRIQVTHLLDDFHSVVIHYGFMEQPDIPQALEACGSEQLRFDLMDTSFFVGRLTIVPAAAPRMSRIRIRLFEAMHRNALAATEFFRIPPNRVIELGGQIEL